MDTTMKATNSKNQGKSDIQFNTKQFIIIALLGSIIVQIAENARGFIIFFPINDAFWGEAIETYNIAPLAPINIVVWTIWGFILSFVLAFIVFTSIKAYGNNGKTLFLSGTVTTVATLGISWIANVNTGYGTWGGAALLVFLAWIELVAVAYLIGYLYKKKAFAPK